MLLTNPPPQVDSKLLLRPLAIKALKDLICICFFIVLFFLNYLSVAVSTIKLLFVFLYDVIGSSVFHNYDGYTVETYGSIC